MLKRGRLAKRRGTDGHDYVCIVVSVDPPTRCCGWESCGHKAAPKRYTPMAKVIWQTGRFKGQEKTIMAHLLETIE